MHNKKDTFLKQLYPNTKLWMALCLTIVLSFTNNNYIALAVLIISSLMVYTEGFIFEFKLVAFAIITMGLSMYLINGTLSPTNDYTQAPMFVIPILNWKMYEEGVLFATKTFLRIAPLMSSLFLLFRTMNMTDLGVAMNEGGLSYKASFVFITTFQMLPLLGRDMGQIMDAQKARGLNVDGSVWQRFKAFIPVMVPVVSNSIMKVQDQAIALETKGFNSSGKKTIYRELQKTKYDSILKFLSIGLSIVVLGLYIYGKLKK